MKSPTIVQGVALAAIVLLLAVPAVLGSTASGASPRLLAPPEGALAHGRSAAAAPVATLGAASTIDPATLIAGCEQNFAATPASAGPLPSWNQAFFNDVNVTFSIPYVSPINMCTVPNYNVIPMAAPGFWMNITAKAPIEMANVTIWGTQWPVQNRTAPIPGFNYQNTTLIQMVVNHTNPELASFFFDDYRFFWPGDTVNFNLTVTARDTVPATVYSTEGATEETPRGSGDFATWIVNVQGPWASDNFNSSVEITTTPNIFSHPAYLPNRYQSLQITLTAIAPPGVAVGTIPEALLYYTVYSGGVGTSYSEYFSPLNHTSEDLAVPIPPQPNSTVDFNVTLWLPWEAGAIDRMYSPEYQVNWSSQGGWYYADQGLLSNLELSSSPSIFAPASGVVSAGAPVTVTLHEPIENVTIGSSQLDYIFHDGLGVHSGILPMTLTSGNTSTVTIPGLPPGAAVEFYVVAKDIFGDPVFSQNFTYHADNFEPGSMPAGEALLFFEVVDVSGTGLVPLVNFTIDNASWSESRSGTSLGFGSALVPGQEAYLPLGLGTYELSVEAFGRTFSTPIDVTNSTPSTVTFYVASSPIPEDATSSLPTVPIASVLGLAAAAGALVLILPWYAERRRRIEEEQRRITL